MIEVNSENFQEQVLNNKLPVVVDFWADWCMPCKMFAPTFEKVGKDFDGKVVFAKVNVDQNQELAQKHDVRGIPCMIIFKDGKEADRLVGALDEGTFRSKISAI